MITLDRVAVVARGSPPAMPDALAYRAPFLIEKLLKDHVVDTAEEAEALFTEVKRYLVLNQVDRSRIWKMYSLRVDEVWHQFVLFTAEYVDFCKVQFGRYVHHSPSNAPDRGQADRAPEATFAEFGERYRELFGVDLPELWDDATSVTPHRRILNDHAGKLRLTHVDGMIDLIVMDGHCDGRPRDFSARDRILGNSFHRRDRSFLRPRTAGRPHRRGEGRPGVDAGGNEAAACGLSTVGPFRSGLPMPATPATSVPMRLWWKRFRDSAAEVVRAGHRCRNAQLGAASPFGGVHRRRDRPRPLRTRARRRAHVRANEGSGSRKPATR